MAKKQPVPDDERALDALAERLRNVDPERLKTLLNKTERIEIRVSRSDYESITKEAKRRQLSISSYLLDCHVTRKRSKQRSN